MDEWLIRTVMALYTEACTVVRTDAGLSYEVKIGMHQESVVHCCLLLSWMLFLARREVVCLPSALLYADDLVIMAPTREQLGRWVADWSASLLVKGLKVNAGKFKVMVDVGKEYRRTLFSAQYVKMDSGGGSPFNK